MNALYAAPLGIAAALVGTLADVPAQAAEEPKAEPMARSAAEPIVGNLAAPDAATPALPAPDLLAPEYMEVAARLEASDPSKICDDKCQVVALAETTLPNTGAADILSVVLEPDQHGLDIPNRDGTPALTIRVVPSKIARGEGLIATAKF